MPPNMQDNTLVGLNENVKEAARMATPEHKSAEENEVMLDAH